MKVYRFTSGYPSINRGIHQIAVETFIGLRTSDHLIFSLSHHILLITFLLLTISSCAGPSKDVVKERHAVSDRARISEDYAVVLANASDTYDALAEKYYGDRRLAYIIAEFNKNKSIVPDQDIVIPLKPVNPGGLYPGGYQTVTILCYHQFSKKKTGTKISISEEMFDQQMAYLKQNGYNVITLNTLHNFINYRRRPPKNSVVITIDDGWKTAMTIAAPILKKYGFKATLFVYTDLIRSKPNNLTLCWDEIKELADDGVIEVQSHTVSHADLTKITEESLERELEESQRVIKENLGIKATGLAYPYGNFNTDVVEKLKKLGYESGFTVVKGGNPFFTNNFSLNRSMVFNSDDIDDFTKLLETFKQE